jgi:ribosome-binding factor A
MPHRPERLGEMIREELIDVISGELRDPRVGLAQVTEVKLAPDMHVAHVFVSVMGGPEEEQETLRGLIAARGYLRGELARRLQVRQIPELRFELDRSEELGLRLEKLLSRARKRSGKSAPEPARDPEQSDK